MKTRNGRTGCGAKIEGTESGKPSTLVGEASIPRFNRNAINKEEAI